MISLPGPLNTPGISSGWRAEKKRTQDPFSSQTCSVYFTGGHHKSNWKKSPQFPLALFLSFLKLSGVGEPTKQIHDSWPAALFLRPSNIKVALSGNVITWVGCFPVFLLGNLEAGSHPHTKKSSELHRRIVHGQRLPRLAGPSHCIC